MSNRKALPNKLADPTFSIPVPVDVPPATESMMLMWAPDELERRDSLKRTLESMMLMWAPDELERRDSLKRAFSPEDFSKAFRPQAIARRFKEALVKLPDPEDTPYSKWVTERYESSLPIIDYISYSNPMVIQEKRDHLQSEVHNLLETDEETIAYACKLIDQFPSACFLLPTPDLSATDNGEVYFEWLLETDGRLLLTVAPDGTVAYVCKFGTARSKNLGAWEDKIADLIPPCFARLVQIYQKDSHEWDASKIAHPSPDLSSKETR